MGVLHAVSVFFGCIVSATGVAPEERHRMAHLVQTQGGTFSADLHSTCTHLIVAPSAIQASQRASPKMAYARKWNIPMISTDWLYESLSKRICLDYQPFRLAESTPPDTSQEATGYTQSFLYDDLTVEEVASVMLPPYLEGLHIYVGEQQAPQRLALLKRLILNAGGTRYADLFDRSLITHYLVHNQTLTPRDRDQLRQFGEGGPLVVHDQWLFACFYAKERVPIEHFVVPVTVLECGLSQMTAAKEPIKTVPVNTIWSLKSLSSYTALESINGPAGLGHLPLFAGLTFRLLFASDPLKLAQLTDSIEKHGGSVIMGLDSLADYTICPMVRGDQTSVSHQSLFLNELWLESSVQQNQILPTDNPFYQSITCPSSIAELSHLRISLSGYAGVEREFLARIATNLGAAYTENLSRRNTHLLAAHPSGPKYEFAQTAGIRCVKAEWLRACARMGKQVDELNYPVAFEREKDVSDDEETIKSSPMQASNKENNPPITPTPIIANEFAKRPLSIDTPLRLELNRKLKEVGATIPPTGLTQDSCATTLHSISKPPVDPSTILRGYIFAISQRLWHRREEMHDLVTELGGTFVWSYDTSCTHYIHQGNMMEETFREFRTVRQHGKWIVSPWWLSRSRETGSKLSETDFPHTFNPNVIRALHDERNLLPMSLDTAPNSHPEEVELPKIDFEAIIAADRRMTKNTPAVGYSLSPQKRREMSPSKLISSSSKVFAFSALSAEQRASFPNTLSSLGATVLKSTNNWEPEATHLIIGMLTKSEKFLCACAAGCWILRSEYVAVCNQHGALVDERKYEWLPGWSEGQLAKAPRYWRELVARSKKRAFEGWRVLLVADQKRLPSLKAILLAGNAKVYVLGSEDLTMIVGDLTHVLVSSTQIKAKIPGDVQSRLVGKFHPVELIAGHLLEFDKPKL